MPPSVTLSLLDHYVNHLHLFAYESIFYVCGSLPRTFTLFLLTTEVPDFPFSLVAARCP